MSTWPEQRIQEVADGIVTIVHGHGEVGVSNASFITEDGHALVVDTMTFPEMTTTMVQEIARRGAQVDTVLNTHHHIDHMGGNTLFPDAQLLAHPGSIRALQRLGFPAKIYDRLMPQFSGRFDELELAIPMPFQEPLILPRGGELHVFQPAHTAADTTVWFPDARVLLTGDIGFINVVPLSVNGLISSWHKALNTLIELKPAIVVPGHGPVGTLADLVILRDYFAALEHSGRLAVAEQLSLQDALALFEPGPLSTWIEPERHEINLERAMQEARGEITSTDLSTMPSSARKP